ncbi:hypothetical protein [Tenacibaculum singaporense]|uniref:Homeodomain phBC6A51-type domain-containing protein n=1 Tax=Tenacibaculum singaporense TaxID=2358479 RepID=A0A3S5HIA2_9FLAO|nr:hypothetical protein [Tenacibaculum singaporense]AZJ36950.1 hypothetical protein D6T69_15940 [Tenacibaculum singaporense]
MRNQGKKLSTAQRKEAMIEAMRHTLHNVSAATRYVGVSRTQHYEWLKTDPEYKASIEEVLDIQLDFAFAALMKLIGEGKFPAIKYFLETKGKHRGWGASKAIRNYNYQSTPQLECEFEQMTDEELDLYIKDNE